MSLLLLPDQIYGEEVRNESGQNLNSYEDDDDLICSDITGDEDESSESETTTAKVKRKPDQYGKEMRRLLKSLEIWDEDEIEQADVWQYKCKRFLSDNNIRPDFFCQYQTILGDYNNHASSLIRQNKQANVVVNNKRPRLPPPPHKKTDATSTGEAVNLQNRLRSLSTGLVGLRNCLHDQQGVVLPDVPQVNGYGNSASQGQTNMTTTASSNASAFTNQQPNVVSHHMTNGHSEQNDFLQEGFDTLRSVRSHVITEASSVMTANVSDPASGSSHSNNGGGQHCQMSPPQPISTLQHNYSNLQQPVPRPNSNNNGSLSSSRTQSSNASPAVTAPGSPFGAPMPPAGPPPPVPGETEGGAFSRSAVRPRTPTEEKAKRKDRLAADEARKSKLAQLKDLIHLESPLNEDAVIRTLQARFFNQKYFTNVGPIVLSVNPYRDVGNPLTLTSTKNASANCPELARVVGEAVRLQSESGYPQAIIVSGASGSGKTHASMVLLRQLFDLADGGGIETDTFKHLSAAFTVLRSLGSAQTATNRESSRVGHFIEVQVSDGALYRTKIHCYFLDQGRVVRPPPTEKSYHIFYQMMAGLNPEERMQLGLEDFTVRDLLYLNMGDTRQDEVADAQRFAEWKANLAVLGIPFMDVVRVMAAILLLGNVEFAPRGGDDAFDIEIIGKDELNSVSKLLGVTTASLWQGLTSRTHSVRGQPVKSMSDSNLCNATRNALAKALYCRTVATIVRRANSLKRPVGPLSGTMSTDSNDSVHHELASHHASTVGTSGSRKSSRSMALLNQAVRHATDGFIGILDMFGFEDSKPSQLEQLCINLCSETMQHFYNTHIFKSSIESCREEGIASDVLIDYVDNVPCIDLISSLRTGLLSMLDVECSVRGFPETYVQKVKVQHKDNRKLFEPKHCDMTRTFGIHHYAGPVVYDTSDFLDTNRDVIPDDLVSVFARESCQFGFATHLFGNEIKSLVAGTNNGEAHPRGASFRISPTSTAHISGNGETLLNGDEPVSTLTQDFHTRLDNLLRTLVHAKPHFVRCIRPNEHDSLTEFDRAHVASQVRSLQILETVNLMAGGFPHRMRFKAFNARYRSLAHPMKMLLRNDEKAVDDCEFILDCYSRQLKQDQLIPKKHNNNNCDWAHGRKHIFLSEGARQQLEQMRDAKRHRCATKIQSIWRGYHHRRTQNRNMNNNNHVMRNVSRPPAAAAQHHQQINMLVQMNRNQRTRPLPIAGTPPPLDIMHTDRCDFKTIQQTCSLFGLDLERPPPVPPSRPYTVTGSKKITFPQSRVMRQSFPEDGSGDILLLKGETVIVIGNSPRRGHLVVERHNHTIHVPYKYLEIKQPIMAGMGI